MAVEGAVALASPRMLAGALHACASRIALNESLRPLWTVTAQLVELKNGETYNGHMVNCDTWMNIHLREVICTSKVRPAG